MANRKLKADKTTEASIAQNCLLYAVLRLNEAVDVTDVRGEAHKVKVNNDVVAGYIPVYKTVEEAQKHSQDGKYSIVAISA